MDKGTRAELLKISKRIDSLYQKLEHEKDPAPRVKPGNTAPKEKL